MLVFSERGAIDSGRKGLVVSKLSSCGVQSDAATRWRRDIFGAAGDDVSAGRGSAPKLLAVNVRP